jgi:hypothetical protein
LFICDRPCHPDHQSPDRTLELSCVAVCPQHPSITETAVNESHLNKDSR